MSADGALTLYTKGIRKARENKARYKPSVGMEKVPRGEAFDAGIMCLVSRAFSHVDLIRPGLTAVEEETIFVGLPDPN